MPRSAPLFARGRRGWVEILLTVLLAFSWQSFLTQTHAHFENASVPSFVSPEGDAAPQNDDSKAPSGVPDHCWICRAIAHADHLLLPQLAELGRAPTAGFWFVALALRQAPLAQASHAWNSRAPPLPLQA